MEFDFQVLPKLYNPSFAIEILKSLIEFLKNGGEYARKLFVNNEGFAHMHTLFSKTESLDVVEMIIVIYALLSRASPGEETVLSKVKFSALTEFMLFLHKIVSVIDLGKQLPISCCVCIFNNAIQLMDDGVKMLEYLSKIADSGVMNDAAECLNGSSGEGGGGGDDIRANFLRSFQIFRDTISDRTNSRAGVFFTQLLDAIDNKKFFGQSPVAEAHKGFKNTREKMKKGSGASRGGLKNRGRPPTPHYLNFINSPYVKNSPSTSSPSESSGVKSAKKKKDMISKSPIVEEINEYIRSIDASKYSVVDFENEFKRAVGRAPNLVELTLFQKGKGIKDQQQQNEINEFIDYVCDNHPEFTITELQDEFQVALSRRATVSEINYFHKKKKELLGKK